VKITHPEQGATQVFSPTQLSFTHPEPCLNSNAFATSCAPMGMLVCNEVCSGALLACFYFEATEIDCTIDQQIPGLKSLGNIFFILFKGN